MSIDDELDRILRIAAAARRKHQEGDDAAATFGLTSLVQYALQAARDLHAAADPARLLQIESVIDLGADVSDERANTAAIELGLGEFLPDG